MSGLTRRTLLASGAGLVVSFSLRRRGLAQGGEGAGGPKAVAPGLPGALAKYPMLDSWIRVDPQGHITVFTGKAELGQGIRTAFLQLAAQELDVDVGSLVLVTADTAHTPDEGVTAGSHSMQDSGTAVRAAAAQVREHLVAEAGRRWSVPPEQVTTGGGAAHAADGRSLGYGELAAALSLHVAATPAAPTRQRAKSRPLARVDIPAKLTGGRAYVQDMQMPGLLHARVVRGPSYGTALTDADCDGVARLPGVAKLVRDGRFVAVLAEREWTAVTALRQLQAAAWRRTAPPLATSDPAALLRALPAQDVAVFDYPGPPAPPDARQLSATYTRPFLMHGSIGPSCAVALFEGGAMTVWTHTQGAYPLQKSLVELLRLPPDKVRCIHVEGAGCYGHNGADDVAADAALAARAVPGQPVRMQWMREQEHGWEPLGPAMIVQIGGAIDAADRICEWRTEIWSNEHNGRPHSGGGLLAGGEVEPAFPPQTQKPIPMPEGGASRNSNPLYALPNAKGLYHFIAETPVRISALRSLGGSMNVFALESFMDELATAAHADPVAFRLAHLQDERARDVIQSAADRFRWTSRPKGATGHGCGFAFARYKNLGAYCALAMEIEVSPDRGRIHVRRVVAAVDSGEAVSVDGIRNQIEGGIVQSLSWTTQEAASFDAMHRTSFDWSTYPILRFEDLPDRIDVHVLDRPGQPFLGTGEAAQGPAAAAIANAVADATGLRLRDTPLSPERIRAAFNEDARRPIFGTGRS